jgi:lipopolysaccharide/colanic/teichoic acid biosynthesis glycosyltransferase
MDHVDNQSWREEAPPAGGEIPRWKRALDITLILLALPLLAPAMLFIAVLIYIVSDGPVLFRQERVGYRGRRFRCFKFRTMVVGDNTAIHQGHLQQLMSSNRPMVKMDVQGDPRIIPCGLPLRSSGLDELPQIINVLRGDMSLVGPRPCVPYEYEKYLPWQKERFNTLPGLTGLWQVSGKNKTTFEEMIQLDIRYARTKSPWLDLAIICKTIPALMVQMIEVRRDRKALEFEARPKTAGLGRVLRPGMVPAAPHSRRAFISMEKVKTQEKT